MIGRLVGWTVLVLAIGCGESTGPRDSRPNILLVTLDTTRADHLGCYGASADPTPRIDRLAADGARFTAARTPVPLTLPAHASLFTGRIPPRHGVRANGLYRLGEALPTLPQLLQEAGYRTAAFIGAFVLDEQFGLGRGFDHYDDAVIASSGGMETFEERPADAVVDAALQWWDPADSRPALVWAHFFDPHHPYAPPAEFADKYSTPYQGEIAFTDAQLGRLLDGLEQADPDREWAVVVTADHGEGLGDHGELTHGHFVYDTTVRVPLVVRGPGFEGGRQIGDPVSLVDVLPTVLHWAEVDIPLGIDGQNLTSTEGATRWVYCESELPRLDFGFAPLRALANAQSKWVGPGNGRLFWLAADEIEDVAAENADLARRLAELADRRGQAEVEAAQNAVDSAVIERIKSLGYTSGNTSAKVQRAEWTDAELLGLIELRDRGNTLMATGQADAAIEALEELVQRVPESYVGHELLGTALAHAKQYARARIELEAAIEREPRLPDAHWNLGLCLYFLGDEDAAVTELQLVLELDPRHRGARRQLALRALEADNVDAARVHLEELARWGGGKDAEWARGKLEQLSR